MRFLGAAAATAGFPAEDVEAALSTSAFVIYTAFPQRRGGDVIKVRTIDDWPDDPPLNNR